MKKYLIIAAGLLAVAGVSMPVWAAKVNTAAICKQQAKKAGVKGEKAIQAYVKKCEAGKKAVKK